MFHWLRNLFRKPEYEDHPFSPDRVANRVKRGELKQDWMTVSLQHILKDSKYRGVKVKK